MLRSYLLYQYHHCHVTQPKLLKSGLRFETLNQVLKRLNRRKAELLLVLERPDLPLHNNASEQDIREFVTIAKDQWQHSQ